MVAEIMSNQTLMLQIDPWDEGPIFRPVLERSRQRRSLQSGEQMAAQPLTPVGFYVAYSYILFRRQDDSPDSLYAFF